MGFFEFFRKKEATLVAMPKVSNPEAWSLISGASVAGKYVHGYIDLAAVETIDGNKRAVVLTDLEEPDSMGFRSFLAYVEFDAKNSRRKVLRTQFYQGSMSSGVCLATVGESSWEDIEPGDAAEAELKAVFQ